MYIIGAIPIGGCRALKLGTRTPPYLQIAGKMRKIRRPGGARWGSDLNHTQRALGTPSLAVPWAPLALHYEILTKKVASSSSLSGQHLTTARAKKNNYNKLKIK